MATSVVSLVNRALTEIGQQPIADITEDNARARAANRVYESVRDEVLAAHQWNEAVARAGLNKLAAAPDFGFDSQFQLPPDFLRLVKPEYSEDEFRLEGDKLLANDDEFNIVYIARITDVAKMRPGLQEAIAMKLAATLSIPLSNNGQLKQQIERKYENALLDAKFADSQQSPVDQVGGSTWLDARENGGLPSPYRHL